MAAWPWRLDILSRHGNPYMTRWRLLPVNPVFNVHLHRFHCGDDMIHDHPYPFVAVKLRGMGTEHIVDRVLPDGKNILMDYRQIGWMPRFYGGRELHRIYHARGLWTLNFIGPEDRVWGVIDEDSEWRPFYESTIQWRRNCRLYSKVLSRKPRPNDSQKRDNGACVSHSAKNET